MCGRASSGDRPWPCKRVTLPRAPWGGVGEELGSPDRSRTGCCPARRRRAANAERVAPGPGPRAQYRGPAHRRGPALPARKTRDENWPPLLLSRRSDHAQEMHLYLMRCATRNSEEAGQCVALTLLPAGRDAVMPMAFGSGGVGDRRRTSARQYTSCLNHMHVE